MLWRFIQPNAKESETEEVFLNLTGLTKRELRKLVDIRFLLSDPVNKLIDEIAPKVVNQLLKESVNAHIMGRGMVRGRIDWNRTINARAAAGNDTSVYVYSRRSQIYDLPENRLFLYLVKKINEMARSFTTDECMNLTWYIDYDKNKKWVDKIAVIAAKTSRILRNPYVLKIGNFYELSEKTIELTKKCRPAHYKDLAETAEIYVFSNNAPISYLKEELDSNIFEPLNRDTLYEIAVLFRTIQTALELGWKEKRVGLIGGNSRVVSILKKNESEIKVYFQKLPYLMTVKSQYGDIMADYGLSEKLRRPDIILEISGNDSTDYFIIEVKRSRNRRYLVDGTYKLLGYLKDFERVNEDKSSIKGFLVGWKGIELSDYSSAKEVHLFNWDNYVNGLQQMLESK
jgi:hypothetical protein